jgi:electron transport complex protein RnfG
MRSIKHFFEQSWLLVVASFAFGLLIAVTNAALSERIEQNRIAKFNRLAQGLIPDANEFVPVEQGIEVETLGGKSMKLQISQALANGVTKGWVFVIVGSGFGGPIELIVAVDASFSTMAGFDVLSSTETPGFGDQIKNEPFRGQFEDAPAEPLTLVKVGKANNTQIAAITGATVSSNAVVTAINHFLPEVKTQLQQKELIGNGN